MANNINDYVPSVYQQAIYDFIINDNRNLVVEATAGSGKTTTLIHALNYVPKDKRVLFCAFNRDIVNELKKQVGNKDMVDVRTVHSIGYSLLIHHLNHPKDIEINESKYRTEFINHKSQYTFTELGGKRKFMQYVDNVIELLNHIRFNLCGSDAMISEVVERHQMQLMGDEIDVAKQLLVWGTEHLDTIDYTDMIYLPIALEADTTINQFDYIFCDEAQDISIAQRELLKRCGREGCRYIFCGDRKQAIYAFADADPNAFTKLQEMPNTISLPLSISYRCPKKVVELARTISPNMEWKDGCIDGEIKMGVDLESVEDGDMVLCRNNAPLMQAYFDLIHNGKQCSIRGKDIGSNLKKILRGLDDEDLDVDMIGCGLFIKLYSSLFKMRDSIMHQYNMDEVAAMNSSMFVERWDKIRTLHTIAKEVKSVKELSKKIDEIFSDKKNGGISLSTIHKAKGLEADNVFILCSQLMPSKSAVKDWEKEQENNLIYVAYTRCKKTLGFIKENDKYTMSAMDDFKMLRAMEAKVNSCLERQKRTFGKSKNSILKSKKPSLRQTTTKKIDEKTTIQHENPFASLIKKKTIKKNKIDI